MPDLDGAAGAILLADPATFPTDAVLQVPGGVGAGGAADRRPGLRAGRGRRHRAVQRHRGARRGRGRRAARRRRGAPVRVAGRRADRPRADDHRRRGARDRRAGRQAGAGEAARDDRGAARGGPRAGAGRAADGDRRRDQQARLRAGRLPRARPDGRRSRHRPGRGRRRGAAGPGRPAARARRRERRPRPARGARHPHGGARRPRAGRSAAVLLQRPRPWAVRAQRPRRRGWCPTSSPARPPRASSRPARSGRSAASRSCTASRQPSPCSPDSATLPRHEPWGSDRARDRRERRIGAGDRARARPAGREPGAVGAQGRGARGARGRDRRPRRRGRPLRPRRGRAARRGGRPGRRPGRQRRHPGQRPAGVLQRRPDRPRARRQPARADGHDPPDARGDGRARRRPHRLRVVAERQGRHRPLVGLRRDQVRAARLRR